MKLLFSLAMALAAGTAYVGKIQQCAAQECCDHCGCSCCQKVCRCVPDVKKVPKVTYSCECEDFCVPGRSERCVTYDECGKKKYEYSPTCAQVKTRKKLVKHEEMEEKKAVKWVVETLCCECANRCAAEPLTLEKAQAIAASGAKLESGEVQTVSFLPPTAGPAAPATAALVPADAAAPEAKGLKADLKRMLQPIFGKK